MKDFWKRKLTSRKFWCSLVCFITSLLVSFNVPQNSITQIVSVITSFSSLIIYVLVEGYVDGSYKGDEDDKQE